MLPASSGTREECGYEIHRWFETIEASFNRQGHSDWCTS